MIDRIEQHRPAEAEDRSSVGEDVGSEDVVRRKLTRPDQRGQGHFTPVVPEHLGNRRSDDLPARFERREHGRLEYPNPDVETDNHEDRAREKWNPPAPRH